MRRRAPVPPTAVGADAIDVHLEEWAIRCMLQVERCTQHNPVSAPISTWSMHFQNAEALHIMPDVDRMRT